MASSSSGRPSRRAAAKAPEVWRTAVSGSSSKVDATAASTGNTTSPPKNASPAVDPSPSFKGAKSSTALSRRAHQASTASTQPGSVLSSQNEKETTPKRTNRRKGAANKRTKVVSKGDDSDGSYRLSESDSHDSEQLETPSEEDYAPRSSLKRKKTAAKKAPTSKRVAPSQASSSKRTAAPSQASTSRRATSSRASSSKAASSVKQTQPSRTESPSRPGAVEEDGEEEDDEEVDVPHVKTIGSMLRGSGEEWSPEQLERLDFPVRDLPSTSDVQRELGQSVQGHPEDNRGHMRMFDVADELPPTISVGNESYDLVKTGGTAYYQGPAPFFKRVYALRRKPTSSNVKGCKLQGSKQLLLDIADGKVDGVKQPDQWKTPAGRKKLVKWLEDPRVKHSPFLKSAIERFNAGGQTSASFLAEREPDSIDAGISGSAKGARQPRFPTKNIVYGRFGVRLGSSANGYIGRGKNGDIRLCQHKGCTAAAELAGIDSCLFHYQQAVINEKTTTWGLVTVESDDQEEADDALDVWEPLLMLLFGTFQMDPAIVAARAARGLPEEAGMFGLNADSALKSSGPRNGGSGSREGVQNELYKTLLRRNQAAIIRAVECDFAVANAANSTARAAAETAQQQAKQRVEEVQKELHEERARAVTEGDLEFWWSLTRKQAATIFGWPLPAETTRELAALRRKKQPKAKFGKFKVRFRTTDKPTFADDLAICLDEDSFDQFRGWILEIGLADEEGYPVKVRYTRAISRSFRRLLARLWQVLGLVKPDEQAQRLAGRTLRLAQREKRRKQYPADYDSLKPLARQFVDGTARLNDLSELKLVESVGKKDINGRDTRVGIGQTSHKEREPLAEKMGWDPKLCVRGFPMTMVRVDFESEADALFYFGPGGKRGGKGKLNTQGEKTLRHEAERRISFLYFSFDGKWVRLPLQINLNNPAPDPMNATWARTDHQHKQIIDAARQILKIPPRPPFEYPPGVERPRGGYYPNHFENGWRVDLWKDCLVFFPEASINKVYGGKVDAASLKSMKVMTNIAVCKNKKQFKIFAQWSDRPWFVIKLTTRSRDRLYSIYQKLKDKYAEAKRHFPSTVELPDVEESESDDAMSEEAEDGEDAADESDNDDAEGS